MGKMVRAQGKHREFGINWSVATLENLAMVLTILYSFFREHSHNFSLDINVGVI